MAKKETETLIEKIFDYSLEEIMGDRFGRYSKYIIQDRALPDVRDGLKPVQRRILFSMYKDKNTYDKPTRKSAKAVGNVMGQYHPHGDSSIYDAMVRMSQNWKQREILIDMQGNNGSIDGDGPAAMRYTEARLAKISNVLLKDIEKDTVEMAPTFDDEALEPTVLPAHFPQLLVNGANGISAGYATNIPPHNLSEVIDATIKRIDGPNCRLDTIMEIIKGPDFPTGGVVEGIDGIKQAYETGKGRVVVSSKYEFVTGKKIDQIIINEIPYDTLKCNIIRKIEEIRLDKKIDGIIEVRDESDKNDNLRIVIDIKKEAKKDLIINYLLKNTDLQINYNFNVVAIVNRRPKTLGLLEILDAFIEHKKEVVLRRCRFDLEHAEARVHILEGFIRALDILDEIIKTIRRSKNKQDSIENLIKEFEFTRVQAEAIVNMQLYKLSNTDVTDLKNELENLKALILDLKETLESEEKLKTVMKNELREIKKEYGNPRKTVIKDEVSDIVIDELDMVSKDDYIVTVSKSGYVKKVSLKSYNASSEETTGLKDGDYVEGLYKLNNLDTLIVFTNKGNYLYIPVRNINEYKYKDIGMHISNIVSTSEGETLVRSIGVPKKDNFLLTAFTKKGMTKSFNVSDLEVLRYSKPITMFKLKDDDELVNVSISNGTEVLIVTKKGMSLKYSLNEIPVLGPKASGVKAIKLGEGDFVISAFVLDPEKEFISLFTNRNTAKRVKVEDISKISRAKKGNKIMASPKSKEYTLIKAFNTNSKTIFGIVREDIAYLKSSDINIMDLRSVGSVYTKKDVIDAFIYQKLKEFKKETSVSEVVKEDVTIQEEKKEEQPKEKKLTMSDFFDEFKL